MSMRALALDPGMSTGAAALLDNGAIWTSTVPARDGDMSDIIDLIVANRPQVIVIEQFLTRGLLSKYGIETIKIVGAVECMHHFAKNGSDALKFTLISRTPSQRMVRVPEAERYMRARRANTNIPFTDHEIDALAHLFGWMRQEGIPYDAAVTAS